MAKRFFYLSGGLLMLVFTYQFGSTVAAAQATGAVLGGLGESCGGYSVVVDRVPHRAQNAGAGLILTGSLPPIPGSSEVVAFGPCTDNAILANGDVYEWTGTDWHLKGNVLGAPTETSSPSWGQVKARYR